MAARAILAALVAALALAAPAAAHDAEIFATNNTALITDPNDPRLDDRLEGFARRVDRIIERGGGKPRGSELLDGVFFSADIGGTTFERSRVFDVDRVDDAELRSIAEAIGARFRQQSVLTFDRLHPRDPEADAIELEVPGVTAEALRAGLLADAEARERLFGGSVTLDGHLILVADRADEALARTFAERIGGDLRRAVTRHGEREFVEPPPVVLHAGTLYVDGGERAALDTRTTTLKVDLGDDGSTDFAAPRRAVRRVRVASDGALKLAAGDHTELSARRGRVVVDAGLRLLLDGVERLDLDARDVTVGDLTGTSLQELHGAFERTALAGTGDRDFVSALGFDGTMSVVGLPVFVRIADVGATDRLRIDGGPGDDQLSGSGTTRLTLDGGPGDDVLRGAAGDDLLLGGGGFDDAFGGKGADVAYLGGDFDRFSWAPGDGSDRVDGGPSHDSLFFLGTADAQAFDLAARGRGARLRDGAVVMDLDALEEVDVLAGGGADTFAVGDFSGTPVDLVDVSLAPGFGSPGGDGQADRVRVTGTDRADAIAVAGSRGTARVTGLSATVNITHAEPGDTLAIDTRGGDDVVDDSGLAPDTILLEVTD